MGQQFKVGSVYRDGRGVCGRVRGINPATGRLLVAAVTGDGRESAMDFEHDANTGYFWFAGLEVANPAYCLIPGELTLKNGEWVPVEEQNEEWSPTVEYIRSLARKELRELRVSMPPTLDKLENTTEPQRERLTWADSKPFNSFDGYVTVSDTDPQPKQALSPLQRTSEGERIPGFGSAALLKVR